MAGSDDYDHEDSFLVTEEQAAGPGGGGAPCTSLQPRSACRSCRMQLAQGRWKGEGQPCCALGCLGLQAATSRGGPAGAVAASGWGAAALARQQLSCPSRRSPSSRAPRSWVGGRAAAQWGLRT